MSGFRCSISKSGHLMAVFSRLCLTLSLWHAPLPIWHAHSLAADRVERDEWLSQHVASFHHEESHHEDESTWHLHLMLLSDVCPCGEGDTHRHERPDGHEQPQWKMAVASSSVAELNPYQSWILIAPASCVGSSHGRSFEGIASEFGGRLHGGSFSHACAVQGSLSLHELLAHRVC